jgi:hypothetical protein
MEMAAKDRAKLYNFYGVLYQASAPEFWPEHSTLFYELAIGEFRRAIEIQESWYLPHENLADTYSSWQRKSKELQVRSVVEYDHALEHIDRNNKDELECELEWLRVKVGQATSMLLTGDEDFIREAIDQAQAVEDEISGVVEKVFPEDGKGSKNAPGFAYLLYNLACFYAAVYEKDGARFSTEKYKAQSYLACSLGRDSTRNLWNWAGKDEDLAGIRDSFHEALTLELLRRVREQPELPDLPKRDFQSEIQGLLDKIAQS